MRILILGDVHGCWNELNIVIAKALKQYPDIKSFVQIGDLGYAWPGSKPFKFLKCFMDDATLKLAESIPFYFLDGNHENHDQLDIDQGAFQPNMIYVPRGHIVDFGDPFGRAMFFGGASSIDKHHRVEGKSWWPQESIKYGQIVKALEKEGPINMIFSHEHPVAFPYKSYKDNFGEGDKKALDALRQHFKPRWWLFGHHHEYGTGVTEGTNWACAPIIDSRVAILWDGHELKPCAFI